ncbi:hypothetical protein SBY92_002607 [Candida maltosa Xu316]|uniref:Uncharacterized protein n=1 Tax=Candida maltosa (strain Xu316) TaxID=1245528 RepID=M3IJ84_CANMX|nr:hypothetical protein G210_3310 [Candida maltosa Xu316]
MARRNNATIEKRTLRLEQNRQKKEKEYKKDYQRYQELIKQNLEKDIPPRRIKKVKTVVKELSKKEEEQQLQIRCPPRPKYTVTKKKQKAEVVTPLTGKSKELPPLLRESTARSFENQVPFRHTYPELLKIINENLAEDTIDLPLVHNLAPKNIDMESKRFEIPFDFYKDTSHLPSFTNEIDFLFAETLKSDISLV